MNDENPKKDWFDRDPEVRKNATFKFWEMMESDPVLREKCTNTENIPAASEVARKTLEKAGNFETIPDDVEVRVFEFIREPADKLVTILLPDRKDPPLDPLTFDDEKVWRCSWHLWPQRRD